MMMMMTVCTGLWAATHQSYMDDGGPVEAAPGISRCTRRASDGSRGRLHAALSNGADGDDGLWLRSTSDCPCCPTDSGRPDAFQWLSVAATRTATGARYTERSPNY